MSVAHRFTWLFGLQSLTELKACSPLALYHCDSQEPHSLPWEAAQPVYHHRDERCPRDEGRGHGDMLRWKNFSYQLDLLKSNWTSCQTSH